jgi:cell division septal protein FtsQ
VVSRVLPDRLRVRVIERVPVVVVRTAGGHFVWVDEDAVALGEVKPEDKMPAVFMRGWNEDGTEEARKDNVERVQRFLGVTHEWDTLGVTERVSEMNLIDLRDIRVQLAGNDSQIEVRLGGQDAGNRLKIALEALDVYKQTPRGSSITYVDIQTGRVVIGFSSGGRMATGSETSANEQAAGTDTASVTEGNSTRSGSQRNNQQKLTRGNRRR